MRLLGFDDLVWGLGSTFLAIGMTAELFGSSSQQVSLTPRRKSGKPTPTLCKPQLRAPILFKPSSSRSNGTSTIASTSGKE